MKKISKLLLVMATLFSFINVSNTLVVNAGSNDRPEPAKNYQSVNENVELFYTATDSGSVQGLKGNELLEQLAKILEDNHKYYNTYGELRGGMCYTDEDPENPNNIIYFYSRVSHDNTWGIGDIYNREHVWCKANSSGLFTSIDNSGRGAGADIHHLRPEDKGVNSARSNNRFADLNKTGTEIKYNNVGTGNYKTSAFFEPHDEVKGDCARILMYMYTHYSTNIVENQDRANVSNTATTSTSGALNITSMVYTKEGGEQAAWNLLLSWNELDPVDDFEMNRNNYCTSVTGVRNPFIDHPEFANIIWDPSYDGYGALANSNLGEHQVSFVEEVKPTCTKTGIASHFACSSCDKLFILEDGKYVEKTKEELTIKAAGHSYYSDCDPSCNECEYVREVNDHVDKNKDNICDICRKLIKTRMKTSTKIIIGVSSGVGTAIIIAVIILLILKKKKTI